MSLSKLPSEKLTINPEITNQLSKVESLTVDELMYLKNLIESTLSEHFDLLKNENADMNTSLVSEDGYPRDDIDVLQITLIRRNINFLRNDLRKMIDVLSIKLNSSFNNNNNNNQQKKALKNTPKKAQESNIIKIDDENNFTIPFAILLEILPNSPIAKSGIKNNDKLISINNDIIVTNHDHLSKIKLLLSENGKEKEAEVPLYFKILRQDSDNNNDITYHYFRVIPTLNWENSNGLLGCKLQEI